MRLAEWTYLLLEHEGGGCRAEASLSEIRADDAGFTSCDRLRHLYCFVQQEPRGRATRPAPAAP